MQHMLSCQFLETLHYNYNTAIINIHITSIIATQNSSISFNLLFYPRQEAICLVIVGAFVTFEEVLSLSSVQNNECVEKVEFEWVKIMIFK